MSLEAKGSERFKDFGVLIVLLLDKPKNALHYQRKSQFIGRIGHTHQIQHLIFDQRL